ISFSTGSSWGTMAILYPLIIPTSWLVSQEAGLSADASLTILYQVVSVILAGAVFGDHCSPISDTTILSSLASKCDHIEHVRTQLPYALTVAGISILMILVASYLPLHWSLIYAIAIVLIYLTVRFLGKPEVSEAPG
ncbi:MAG: Na+/H+ antiporter NhaC family protein, partial [Bacteroidetes bacterium]|nr:Na+/H+ antiporter NhaC family protein [Bacteroidota bacterium]